MMDDVFPTNGAQWPAQKAALEKRIGALHEEMEAASTFDQCRFLQGEIAALRWILNGVKPEVRIGVGHATYG